jgi:hypothetical protein
LYYPTQTGARVRQTLAWSASTFLGLAERRFFVPAHKIPRRRAELQSSLAEGHREAARSGLDGSEHGATLGQVGRPSVLPTPNSEEPKLSWLSLLCGRFFFVILGLCASNHPLADEKAMAQMVRSRSKVVGPLGASAGIYVINFSYL